MRVIFDILRRRSAQDVPYRQRILFETADDRETVATALMKINSMPDLRDEAGNPVEEISWEAGCLQKKCGACAMLIDHRPALACDTFLKDLKCGKRASERWENRKLSGKKDSRNVEAVSEAFSMKNSHNIETPLETLGGKRGKCMEAPKEAMEEKAGKIPIVTLEPLSKFPVIRDLLTDRTVLFDNLKTLKTWTEDSAEIREKDLDRAYEASRCLQCGCCLEACPNYCTGGSFYGAAGYAPEARLIGTFSKEETEELRRIYREHIYEGCGKSLACMKVCPAGIDLDRLVSRSNAVSVWRRR